MSSRVALERQSAHLPPQQAHPQSQSRSRLTVAHTSASVHTRIARPALFISCSSRSSSRSSGSSSGCCSIDELPAHSCSANTISYSHSHLTPQSSNMRRPLPQIPPSSQSTSSICSGPSPGGSPSSANARPLRALPSIPPSSPKIQHSIATGFVIQPQQRNVSLQSSTPSPKVLPYSLAASGSATTSATQLHSSSMESFSFPSPSIKQGFDRLFTSNPDTGPSTSKTPMAGAQTENDPSYFHLSSRAPSPQAPTGSRLKVPLARIQTESSSSSLALPLKSQTSRPRLRVQTNLHADKIPSTLQPQAAHPQMRSSARPPPIVRRSSLDSLTTRPTTLLYPDQALSPFVPKKPKIRHKQHPPSLIHDLISSRDPSTRKSQLDESVGLFMFSNPHANPPILGAVNSNDYIEELSPMKFISPFSSGDDDYDYLEDRDVALRTDAPEVTTACPEQRSLGKSVLPPPTAKEVNHRRLSKIRRRLGEKFMQELDVDGGVGVGRVVMSEGEEDDNSSSDDEHLTYADDPDDLVSAASQMIFGAKFGEEEGERSSPTDVTLSMTEVSKTLTNRLLPMLSQPVNEGGSITRGCRQRHVYGSGLLSGKHKNTTVGKEFSRRWFKDKGGKRWEERDVYEVIGALRKL